MKTWDDYKRHVKDISDQDRRNMEEIEEAAAICGFPYPAAAGVRAQPTRLS